MTGIRWILVYLAFVGLVLLAGYELSAKSPQLLGQPLPGWWLAEEAEGAVPWRPRTGLHWLDRLQHEADEALAYYRLMLTRDPDPLRSLAAAPARTASPVFQIGQ